MNVALYMRYSSEKQTEQSIEGQDRVCSTFCEREGHVIVERYIDRATSAYKKTEARIQFKQMISDATKDHCAFDGIVVYKLDRFARNRYDFATYKHILRKHGIAVLSATEPISDSPESILVESLLEGLSEYYSAELSQKIKRGLYESAMKANHTGGLTPLGYKIEDKKLVEDPETSHIVQEAFQLYADGYSVAEICRMFTLKGYKTSTGKDFNKSSFNKMFVNERYIGVYKFNDVRTEDSVPALISIDLWNRVQSRLKSKIKTQHGRQTPANYLLSGKVFCGHCGSRMTGESATSRNGAIHYYYACHKNKTKRECKKKRVPKDALEKAVLEDVRTIFTPENIETMSDLAVKCVEEENAKNSTIPAIREEIADCEKQIDNLTKLLGELLDPAPAIHRINELTKQKKDALSRLAYAEKTTVHIQREQVVWFLSRFATGDITDKEFVRNLFATFVAAVYVYDDEDPDDPNNPNNHRKRRQRFEITYNMVEGNAPITHVVRLNSSMFHQRRIWTNQEGIYFLSVHFYCQ